MCIIMWIVKGEIQFWDLFSSAPQCAIKDQATTQKYLRIYIIF